MRPFDPLFIIEVIPELLPYLWVTLAVVASSVVLGTLLGFVVAVAKLSHHRCYRLLGDGYTWVIRCTPAVDRKSVV